MGVDQMTDGRVDQLLRADARLGRSFIGSVLAFLASMMWTLFFAKVTPDGGGLEPSLAAFVIFVFQIAFYVWYARSAGAAAKLLGDAGWKYVVWILAAPFLARIPIPIVSTIIGVSPLSIKFLLGGQLQTAIREETMAAVHQSA
jgi:hypothetical protein